MLRETWQPVDALLPLSATALVAELHARGEVATEEYGDGTVHLTGQAPADLAARIRARSQ